MAANVHSDIVADLLFSTNGDTNGLIQPEHLNQGCKQTSEF